MTDPSKEVFDNYLENYERNAQGYYRSLEDIQNLHLERFPRWIDRIAKTDPILDAGCATGYKLSLLHELGYQNLTGVDLSAQLITAARLRLPEAIALHCEDVREHLAKTPESHYKAIMFHHVLEHIPREHTIALLRDFRRCLVPGGFLNLKVPNAACLMHGFQCFGDFTHVVHFNELSLNMVLEQAGFDVSNIEIILHPPKLYWSWKHPFRAILRLLNRVRWHVNDMLHHFLWKLADIPSLLRCTEIEIEILVRR